MRRPFCDKCDGTGTILSDGCRREDCSCTKESDIVEVIRADERLNVRKDLLELCRIIESSGCNDLSVVVSNLRVFADNLKGAR